MSVLRRERKEEGGGRGSKDEESKRKKGNKTPWLHFVCVSRVYITYSWCMLCKNKQVSLFSIGVS